ncbi:MAG: type IV secretory system conjugative DNA transfer family protein [Candidatus Portnoybacteria bacterium]|nr:type IV secretory system conjugative DNA transfer family protein [Candidatus Portnoybacteria bacterium]
MNSFWLSILLTIFFLLLAILLVALYLHSRRTKLRSSLGMTLFLVKMPRYEKKEEAQKQADFFKALIGKASQLYAAFSHLRVKSFVDVLLYGYPRVVFEISSPSNEEEIGFYIAVPKSIETETEKAIHGVYPDAQVEKVVEDYTIFASENEVKARSIGLEENTYLPVRTFQEFDTDPLGQIASSLSKVPHYKGASLQVVITPVRQKWYKKGKAIIEGMKKGRPFKKATRTPLPTFGELTGLEEKNAPAQQEAPVDNETIEALSKKISRPAFYANIRLVASAPTEEEAQGILEELSQPFSQFSLPKFNSFEIHEVPYSRLKRFLFDFSFRNFSKKHSFVLNSDELASLFHFPYPGFVLPGLKSLTSKEVPLPTELRAAGVLLLGEGIYRGEKKPVYYASVDDRRRHFYLIGQTGTGKSQFLREMIRQDLLRGEGVGVIDPHGELIEDTLSNVPKERIEDVVLFEPFQMERPQGLNMLEWETPEQKDFAVQEMIAIFMKLFPPEVIGPMFEHYMRNAMLALMANKDNPGTLVEIPRIFTDEDFMQERLETVEDPVVRSFWLREWKNTTGQSRSDMLGYVVSKVGRFIENEMMRNIIGQSHSSFDLSKIMDEKKIFLANLSKGRTGEVNSALLGLTLVSKMQMAALRRADQPQEQRKDFFLYVDEFQNFTTDSIATILSEARKYRLDLTLAHQYIAQLDEKIRNAAFGNVGSIGCFRISQEDADIMEKQFEPDFSRYDLINLPNRQMVLKILINGSVVPAFKMKTVDVKVGDYGQVEAIRKLSHLKYGRDKRLVEKEIIERSRLVA